MLFNIPRINAFLVHFSISFVIFLILAYLIVFDWYPLPYFHTDGGWRGIRIIAGVDLVLGPLLTLIVYKPGKPGLKLDLTLIALAQAAALTWGVWVTHTERPVALVYALDYFTPVAAKSLSYMEFPLESLSMYGEKAPVPVYVDLPKDIEQQQQILAQAIGSGTPLFLFTDLYTEFNTENLKILRQRSDKLFKYLESDKRGKRLLNRFFQTHPELYNHYLFIPLHSRYKRQVIVLDPTNLGYKGSLNINVTEFLLDKGKLKNPELLNEQND
jgi:hypothetical protein